jgi:hypothetical protein
LESPFIRLSKRTWIGIALGFSLVAAILLGLIYLEDIAAYNLRKALDNPNNIYSIKFDKLKLEILRGNVSIKHIEIKPNYKIIDSLKSEGIQESVLAEFRVDNIGCIGANIQGLLTGSALDLEQLYISEPDIKLHFTGIKKATKDTIDFKESLHRLAAHLHDLSVSSIEINNANFLLSSAKQDTFARISNFNLNLSQLHFDSSQSRLPLYLNELTLGSDSLWLKAGKNHEITARNLLCSMRDSTLSLKNLRMTPFENPQEFSSKLTYQQTWLKLFAKQLAFKGVHYEDALFNKSIWVSSVNIEQPTIELYKDKQPKWPYHKRHDIPSALLRKIPLDLNIEHIDVSNGELDFTQKQVDKDELGKLKLTDLNVQISNVTNLDTLIAENNLLVITTQSKLMGKGQIDGTLSFNLDKKADYWSLNATVGQMPMAALNDFLYPISSVKISDGELLNAKLSMNCNRLSAFGTLDLEYENAKIDVMKQDKDDNTLNGLKFVSFIANEVIRTSNLKSSSHYRQGKIDYTRSMDHPFFRFLWFAVQDGLIDTFVGFGDKEKRRKKRLEKGKTGKMKLPFKLR